MHFCENCDNMYYVYINETDDAIQHFCRNCGNINTDINVQNSLVYNYKKHNTDDLKLYTHINKYTKFDPTLPRADNIPCPNVDCISNTDKNTKPDVIYVKYDNANIKFIYICAHCDTSWRNSLKN